MVTSKKVLCLKIQRNGLSDGAQYGILSNVNGVAVNDFRLLRPTNEPIGNENFYVHNVTIDNLKSEPMEIPVVVGPSGKPQLGPAGDVIRIYKINPNVDFPINTALDSSYFYAGTVLSDAQFWIAKHKNTYYVRPVIDENGIPTGETVLWVTANVDTEIMTWAENGSESIYDVINSEFKILTNKDSMNHVMKGNIGYFSTTALHSILDNVNVNSIVLNGNSNTISRINNEIQNGAKSYGVLFTFDSKEIYINDLVITNISNQNGDIAWLNIELFNKKCLHNFVMIKLLVITTQMRRNKVLLLLLYQIVLHVF